jgi:hypothetical protein
LKKRHSKPGTAIARTAETGLSAILQAIPHVGGSLDAAVHAVIDAERERRGNERRAELLDALRRSEITVDSERLQEDEFISNYLAIDSAVTANTRRNKTALFANLLYNYMRLGSNVDHDEVPWLLQVLDSLSAREICALTSLARLRTEWSKLSEEEKKSRSDGAYWKEFLEKLSTHCNLRDKNTIAGILAGLNRTGLYVTTTGALLDYAGDEGRLTPLYDRFAEIVLGESKHIL